MIKLIAIGASYGGLDALKLLVGQFPETFETPMVVVLHIGNNNIKTFLSHLGKNKHFRVKEAEEKEQIKINTIYFAPPNYHLQIEDEKTLSLSTAEKVNFSRPAIDVLFETAAWTFKNQVLGVLLTGSNSDGTEGLKAIKKYGGTTIVENPETAFASTMPRAAINKCKPDFVLDLDQIASKISELVKS